MQNTRKPNSTDIISLMSVFKSMKKIHTIFNAYYAVLVGIGFNLLCISQRYPGYCLVLFLIIYIYISSQH